MFRTFICRINGWMKLFRATVWDIDLSDTSLPMTSHLMLMMSTCHSKCQHCRLPTAPTL